MELWREVERCSLPFVALAWPSHPSTPRAEGLGEGRDLLLMYLGKTVSCMDIITHQFLCHYCPS